MNYRKDIESCIQFIEDHIKGNITIEQVASQSGYSPYHFVEFLIYVKVCLLWNTFEDANCL
ncbi:helix-turn-helix transcriptional regulator [Vallitalea maricola]|uniref:Uncharacterized protein n=1 Tax=Vallitalea maricola TaxID=3074433 RepID=A0ACB5UH05_9FIRM|nr:hypothetical protein AN2V17_11570 [Vallitalea sp. AN17-2]